MNRTKVSEENLILHLEESLAASNMNPTSRVTEVNNCRSYSEKSCSEPKQPTPIIKQQTASTNIEGNQTPQKKVSEQKHSPQETNYLKSLQMTPLKASPRKKSNPTPPSCNRHAEKRTLDHQKSPERKDSGESVSSPTKLSSCMLETFLESPSKSRKLSPKSDNYLQEGSIQKVRKIKETNESPICFSSFSHEDADSQNSCDEYSNYKMKIKDYVTFDIKPCSVMLVYLLSCPCGDIFINNTTLQEHLKSCKK